MRVLLAALLLPLVLAGCSTPIENAGPVATNHVNIPDEWVFEPREIQVKVGTNVTWTNNGKTFHSVTFLDPPFDEDIERNQTVAYTFTEPGTFDYTCKYHPGMDGRVVVTA
ncbi:MAG TPA: cupredoxin domain-containing protein [Candidatus Thermoplasmatota archaeon]|nr:cupredoxin domain-containing protein [Candidatus Thermoplasmatota archaeon]